MSKTITKTLVMTENGRVQKDSYNSIELINIGDDDAKVNNNIPISPGGSWEWKNFPGVEIDEDTVIHFSAGTNPKMLVILYYIK